MKTAIDWLTFRCRNSPFFAFDCIRPAFGTAAELVTFSPGIEGKDGWLRAGEILIGGDILAGRIDYDGESQRGWVRVILTGEGCAWVQDWKALAGVSTLLQEADVRRVDICLTTYDGEVTHDMVVAAHESGQFRTSGAGRPPVRRTIESSDPRAGKTVYIGKREYAKFIRCYEKGFELLKNFKTPETVTHIGGDKVENIYRVEVEFKAVDTFLPWTTLTDRDTFFAGANPFCASLLGRVEGRKMDRLPDLKPIATLDKALENCRVSYGAILRTALEALDGDKMALMERVLSSTHSQALIKAGVLTVAHPI